MKILIVMCLTFLFNAVFLFGEESEHERVGVKKEVKVILTPSFDLQYQNYLIDQVDAQELSEIVGVSAEFDRRIVVSLSAPMSTRFLSDRIQGKSIAQFDFGDLGVGASLNFDDLGISANTAVNITVPTSGERTDQKYGLNGGLGMWNFGFSGKINIIRDPVLLGFGIDFSTSPIPATIKGGEKFKPYDIGIKVSLIQIINSEISTIFYGGLGFHSGLVKVSNPLITQAYIDIPLGILMGISISPWQFTLGLGASLQNSQVFPSLSIGASYAIEMQ